VIGTGDQERVAASLRTVGVPIAAVADAGELTAVKGRRNVEKVQLAGRTVSAKSLVHAGPWIVDRSLAFQAGAGGRERLQSTTLPSNVRVVGTATHDDDPLSLSAAEPWDNVLVCPCMDVSAQDLVNRIDAGETHIEELKRSTSCGMGPCQGVGCWQAMQAVLAVRSGQPVNDAPSCRPPARGLTVAQAAGLDGLLELE
jgi:bacterioferritin-associated ferredoxin